MASLFDDLLCTAVVEGTLFLSVLGYRYIRSLSAVQYDLPGPKFETVGLCIE
jgi:hypothetical protein